MILNIFEAVHYIALALDEHFDNHPIVYKGGEAPDEYKAALPTIYEFVVPPEDRNTEGYPIHAPAIALIIGDMTTESANFEAHICVVNPSTSEAETVEGNNRTGYTFKEGDAYDQNRASKDLYAYALRLGEETLRALSCLKLIDNLTLTAPDPSLSDFPYATCIITGAITYRKSFKAIPSEVAKLL